jgi:hypothetical protein
MEPWIVAIVNIHRGVNAMKTLQRSVPKGEIQNRPFQFSFVKVSARSL